MKTELPAKSKKHKRIIKDITDVIVSTAKDKIAFVILFGSFARGDWVYDSYTEDYIRYTSPKKLTEHYHNNQLP